MAVSIESLISSMKWAAKSHLDEYGYEVDGYRVTLRRGTAPAASPDFGVSVVTEVEAGSVAGPGSPAGDGGKDAQNAITAPLSGICYLSKDADSAPFVTAGDSIAKGQTVCLIEAMKVMTSVVAEADGTIAALRVEDGATVEAGSVLFEVRP
ncbi:acetyl-CoA carboxylase biotin carboxyl carrier protein [Poseidonocella pacifica]|uniref:Biotin carboxyl carrier protein of acetyl-CoA carboxylase n=1 Tax=Poseidonocella pacifica TaxID=871651 RepID=A0A1I0YB62_9RHOB|nr:acetyl-CoA carboxylase biotin carboxyl carrier protein subunit [Poseidonocella pacifica]SFB10635.1 acetyl-CoA carboxylase biotin carboxyl carrier protein [Poseidonocella pacifica]